MGLFEDVVVNARSAAGVVGKKAGQLVDISKLRISAADVNREIDHRMELLGRAVYESRKSGHDAEELITENVAYIDELYEQPDVITAELAAARGQVACPHCGKLNPVTSFYCSQCGTKLAKEEEAGEGAGEEPAQEPVSPEEAPKSEEAPEEEKTE